MDLFERIESRISPEPNTGCWLWMGSITGNGYGNIRVKSGTTLVHKLCKICRFNKERTT